MAKYRFRPILQTLSEKSRWSYHMQLIDPCDQKIDEIFPYYHPMWIIQSQRNKISGKRFRYMRETLLGLTTEQLAAYLRSNRSSIHRYETGKTKIPFATFELMRMLYESPHFRMSHESWDGWFISQNGRLVSPDSNIDFSPSELSYVRQTHSYNRTLTKEVERLTQELRIANEKLERFEQSQLDAEILDELVELEQSLSAIRLRIGKSKVVSLNFAKQQAHKSKEKAA